MFDSKIYHQLGTLLRSHGVKGGAVLGLDLDISNEEILKMELVFVVIDKLPVPFFIEEIKTHSKGKFILKLDDINEIEEADEICNNLVLVEKTSLPDYKHELSIEDLVGYTVITQQQKELGIIEEFIDINLNPMFRIGEEENEILIPANPNFIIEVNENSKVIIIEIPEGLIDLN